MAVRAAHFPTLGRRGGVHSRPPSHATVPSRVPRHNHHTFIQYTLSRPSFAIPRVSQPRDRPWSSMRFNLHRRQLYTSSAAPPSSTLANSSDSASSAAASTEVDQHHDAIDPKNLRITPQQKPNKSDPAYPYDQKMAALLPSTRTGGNYDRIFDILGEMREKDIRPSIFTYNTLLSIFVDTHQDHRMKKLFKAMRADNIEPDAVTRHIRLKWYVRRYKAVPATRLFIQMAAKSEHLSVGTLNLLVMLNTARSDFGRAWEIVYQMKQLGIKPTSVTYTTLLRGYATALNLRGIQHVLETMRAEQVPLRDYTLDQVLKSLAWGRRGQVQVNRRLMASAGVITDQFKKAGVVPSFRTYAILLHLCALDRDPVMARAIFKALKSGAILDASGHPILPDAVHYSNLLRAHLWSGVVDKVLPILQEMVALGFYPDARTWNVILEAKYKLYRSEGALQELRDLFTFVKSHGKEVPLTPEMKQRAIEEATARMKEQKEKQRPGLLSSLKSQFAGGKAAAASEKPSAKVTPAVRKRKSVPVKNRLKQKLLPNYEEITYDMVKEFYPNSQTYSVMINCHVVGGDALHAQLYVKEMLSKHTVSNMLKQQAVNWLKRLGRKVTLRHWSRHDESTFTKSFIKSWWKT